MPVGWRWVAEFAGARRGVVGRFATRRLWGWVRHHPWDAWLMLRVLDTARDPRVSATAARLMEDAWARGAMQPELHRAIATFPVPFPPRPHTHLARRVVRAHLTGDTEERRRLDPDRRILDRCLGRGADYSWRRATGRDWTVDGERERHLAARDRSPAMGGGPGGSGGGGHGVSGSDYGGGGHGTSAFGGSF